MKIHVITFTEGEWDSMTTDPVIAFVNEELAEEYVKIKNDDVEKRKVEDECYEIVELELVE